MGFIVSAKELNSKNVQTFSEVVQSGTNELTIANVSDQEQQRWCSLTNLLLVAFQGNQPTLELEVTVGLPKSSQVHVVSYSASTRRAAPVVGYVVTNHVELAMACIQGQPQTLS